MYPVPLRRRAGWARKRYGYHPNVRTCHMPVRPGCKPSLYNVTTNVSAIEVRMPFNPLNAIKERKASARPPPALPGGAARRDALKRRRRRFPHAREAAQAGTRRPFGQPVVDASFAVGVPGIALRAGGGVRGGQRRPRLPVEHHRHGRVGLHLPHPHRGGHTACRRRGCGHVLHGLRGGHAAHDRVELRCAKLPGVRYRRGQRVLVLSGQPLDHRHHRPVGGLRVLCAARLRRIHDHHLPGRIRL